MSEENPHKETDLTGTDFREINLSGQCLAHSTLTGCKFGNCEGANFVCAHGDGISFAGANISNTTFEKADESVLFSLIGAIWNGVEITHVSSWLTTDDYWCFATNAFVQIGCMQKTLAVWQAIGIDLESLRILHEEQPKIDLASTLAWWQENSQRIAETCRSFQG